MSLHTTGIANRMAGAYPNILLEAVKCGGRATIKPPPNTMLGPKSRGPSDVRKLKSLDKTASMRPYRVTAQRGEPKT